ncbi:MAG: LamG domain-containing protein [Planctomycetes bacterium]|nr:LamG domain-containing protein [Planctomycetota bacterium]
MSKKLIYFVSFVLVLSIVLTSAVKADLIGWWRFNDDFLDSSGLGNDGIPKGDPTFVEGYAGFALELDGNDYVVIDAVGDDFTDTDITLSAWVKTSDSNADWFSCNAGNSGNQVRLTIEGGKFGFDTDSEHALSTTTVSDGQWHLLTFVRSGNIGYTYVDGVMENSYEPADNYASNYAGYTGDFTSRDLWSIGQEWDPGGPSGHLTGIVDDVRIYDRALLEAEILVIMEGGEGYLYALSPIPADGSYFEDTWVNLSWRAGDFALSHDVYLGENFNAVNDGTTETYQGNQTSTFFVVGFPGFPFPDGLVPGTTYYWRIDEVNDTEPNSPWKGDIWSFTVPPKTAYAPNPANGAESVNPDVELSWTGGFVAKLHTVYFGETFDEVDNAAGGSPQGATTYTPGPLKLTKTYYWRIDEFDAVATLKGDVWSFTTQGAVGSPKPSNGDLDVKQTQVLTWSPGDNAASHRIYFGTDKEVVRNADTGSPEYKGTRNLGSESYDTGELEWNSTYYWRIDQVNNTNPDSPWTGPLWNFTTADFLIVDDFESYNDLDPTDPASNRVSLSWIDGLNDPANGSLVGYDYVPFRAHIVHGGLESLPFAYDNSVGKSETTLTLTDNSDWTVNGVNTLTIWFIGSSNNAAENLYVALNGNARVDNDNPDATQATAWTEWNIDLQAFADQGVNLANVDSITVGLSTATGSTGFMFFDDLRLYPPSK